MSELNPSNCTPEQLQILLEREHAAILRDLRHTPGWEVYKALAFTRLRQMQQKFLRSTLTPDEVWSERLRLQAIMEFQTNLEIIVESAVELVDPISREQVIYSFQNWSDV